MLLTPEELQELTNLRRPTAQARQLDHWGIPYRIRTDGTLAVLRVHVETQHTRRPEPRVRL